MAPATSDEVVIDSSALKHVVGDIQLLTEVSKGAKSYVELPDGEKGGRGTKRKAAPLDRNRRCHIDIGLLHTGDEYSHQLMFQIRWERCHGYHKERIMSCDRQEGGCDIWRAERKAERWALCDND